MPVLRPKLDVPLSATHLPAPLMFRSAHVPAHGVYPSHQHAWGEFVYSFSGVMEVKVAERHYLAPPQYGMWLPPDVVHVGLNRREAVHSSLYVSRPLCIELPTTPCALTIGPLERALLEHLRQLTTGAPNNAQEARLLQVLLDRLVLAPRAGSYLPGSEHPQLSAVLQALEAQPGDNRTLAAWATTVHTTERTLMRRCQRDLGMSLAEWRQRLRVVKAMPRLDAGHTVESIALDLGYGSASSFITMFRRLTGSTPDEFRRAQRIL